MESVDVSDIAAVATTLISLAIALMVHRWTQRVDENGQSRQINLEMQAFNQLVLQDDKLLAIEAANHPPEYGIIDTEKARKMYLYFSWINMADNILRAKNAGLVDESQANARLENLSRVLAADKEFIRETVLKRGYLGEPIIKELTRHW